MMFNHSSNRRTFPVSSLLVALILVFVGSSTVHAILRNIKLSGGNISGGDAESFRISSDGVHTVFRGDIRVNDRVELFSVPTLGGERVRLSHDLPVNCNVGGYSIIPGNEQVVYYVITDAAWPNHCGLYAVPIEGGLQIELDPATDGFALQYIKISGDGSNVFFVLAQIPADRPKILYRVPIGGGSKVAVDEVDGPLLYELTPDNAHIVILEDGYRLVLSDLHGAKTTLIEGTILNFKITPDGTHIIYKETTTSGNELFSIPIGGGTPQKLNSPLTSGGDVHDYAITPDSNYVVYTADETVDEMVLLFQAPADGSSSRIHLLPPLSPTPGRGVESFKITPNSKGVVYNADLLVDGRFDIFSVPIEGGTNRQLNFGMINDGDVFTYEITPNSLGVIMIMDYYADLVNELFAVLIDGSWGVKLNDTLVEGGDVYRFVISPDSQGVVYLADQEEVAVTNLYAVPSTGGTPVQVNPALIVNGDVMPDYDITPDSKGVVYLADQELNDVFELFVTFDFQQTYLPMILN